MSELRQLSSFPAFTQEPDPALQALGEVMLGHIELAAPPGVFLKIGIALLKVSYSWFPFELVTRIPSILIPPPPPICCHRQGDFFVVLKGSDPSCRLALETVKLQFQGSLAWTIHLGQMKETSREPRKLRFHVSRGFVGEVFE